MKLTEEVFNDIASKNAKRWDCTLDLAQAVTSMSFELARLMAIVDPSFAQNAIDALNAMREEGGDNEGQ